jgi:hypothetical protein
VEQFFLEVMKIPNYPQRLECWMYKLKFANQVREELPRSPAHTHEHTPWGDCCGSPQHHRGLRILFGLRVWLLLVLQMREMTEGLEVVSRATEQVKGSKKLKTLLEYVLALGNYMNGGTAQGGVYGVKLDVLLKVGASS